jgi:hypothetical protein
VIGANVSKRRSAAEQNIHPLAGRLRHVPYILLQIGSSTSEEIAPFPIK